MENIWLFPTQVSVVTNFLDQDQCKDIGDYFRGKKTYSKSRTLSGNSYSSHNKSFSCVDEVVQNVSSCKNLYNDLSEKFNIFAKSYGHPSVSLTNSWLNFQYKGSVLKDHTHPSSIISAALYIKADDQSSSIYFYNPNPYNKFSEYVEDTHINNAHYSFRPVTGALFLFPSWLLHGGNNKENYSEERIVMSINSMSI